MTAKSQPVHKATSETQHTREIAWGREERDYCERGTMGCCIEHERESFDGSCETW